MMIRKGGRTDRGAQRLDLGREGVELGGRVVDLCCVERQVAGEEGGGVRKGEDACEKEEGELHFGGA